MNINEKIDIDKPLWNQSTYIGRCKHFAFISDYRMIFVSEKRLKEAKQFCEDYKKDNVPPGTKMSDVIYAKQLRDGAFHPDTGELIQIFSRMCCQMPISVAFTASMVAFQKNTFAMLLFPMLHQMHNAIVNYTYRSVMKNGDQPTITRKAFLCAVIASSLVTIGCKRALTRRRPIYAKCVPFCILTTGHFVSLPIMRFREIAHGIPMYIKDEKKPFMQSRVAAVKAISECLIARIAMSIPCLLCVPLLIYKFMPYCFSHRRPWIFLPIETCLCAICCGFAIPFSFAIFPERNSMKPEIMKLYPSEYKTFKELVKEHVDKVYYDKGL